MTSTPRLATAQPLRPDVWRDQLRPLLQRIGGQATSNPVLVGAVLFCLGGTLYAWASGAGSLLVCLVLGTASAAACLVLLGLLRATLLPVGRSPSRPVVALAAYALIGVIGSAFRWFLYPDVPWAPSVVNEFVVRPAFMGMIVLAALAEWNSQRLGERDVVSRLEAELRRRRELESASLEELSETRAEVERQAAAAIEPRISLVRDALAGLDAGHQSDLRAASDLLLDTVTTIVRPLSHRLAEQVTEKAPSDLSHAVPVQGWLPASADVPGSLLPGFATVLMLLAIWGFHAPFSVDPTASAVRLAFGGLAWPILTALKRWWPRRWALLPSPAAVAVLALIYAATHLSLRFSYEAFSDRMGLELATPYPWPFVLAFWLVLGTGLALVSTGRIRMRAAQAELQAAIAATTRLAARQRLELWALRRTLSWVLHGPVQSTLLSAALALTQGEVTPQRLAQVRTLLAEAASHLTSDQHKSYRIEASLAELERVWGHACDVTVSLPPAIADRLRGDVPTTMVAAEIVREAVASAVRHGSAERVVIRFEAGADGLLHLDVTNDGAPLPDAPEPGLGTRMLEQTTFGWSRRTTDEGVRLEAALVW